MARLTITRTKVGAVQIDKYVSPGGSDGTGTGTDVNPWKTVQFGFNQLSAGQTLGLLGDSGGVYDDATATGRSTILSVGSGTGGTSDSVRKIVRGVPGHTATIRGKVQINGNYVTIRNLKINNEAWQTGDNSTVVACGRTASVVGIEWLYLDVFAVLTADIQGIFAGSNSSSISASNSRVAYCWIHDFGYGFDQQDHGIYWSRGSNLIFEHNKIWNIYKTATGGASQGNRGIQAYPNVQDVIIRNNIMDNCDRMATLGDDGVAGRTCERVTIEDNIGSNQKMTTSAAINWQGANDPATNQISIVDNHSYGTSSDVSSALTGVSSGWTHGDPLYTQSAPNFTPLGGGSPAAGKGPNW